MDSISRAASGLISSASSAGLGSDAMGLVPMPIVSGMLPSLSFGGDPEVADEEGGEAEYGIAGAPCSLCESLTWKERLAGFAVCFLSGSFLTISAFGSWTAIIVGKPEKFAISYTLGNVLNICSTLFLVGPARQYRAMRAKHRRVAAGVYLGCILLTLWCVWVRWHDYGAAAHIFGMVLTFSVVVTQMAALLWYGLSYVPYGRSIFSRFVQFVYGWCFSSPVASGE